MSTIVFRQFTMFLEPEKTKQKNLFFLPSFFSPIFRKALRMHQLVFLMYFCWGYNNIVEMRHSFDISAYVIILNVLYMNYSEYNFIELLRQD